MNCLPISSCPYGGIYRQPEWFLILYSDAQACAVIPRRLREPCAYASGDSWPSCVAACV